MSEVLLFAVLGLGPGALIASLAVGIVLNYRGAGAVNLGMGAVAMFAAFVFFGLRTGGFFVLGELDMGGPMPTLPAFAVTMLFCVLLGALWDAGVLRALRKSPPLAKLVASVGLLLVLQAVIKLEYGSAGQSAVPVFDDLGFVSVFGQQVPKDPFVLTGIILTVTALLAAGYRWTRLGLATQAAAENENAAELYGLSPSRLSMANTVLAFALAGGLGVLVAPLTLLNPVSITITVIPALGAALIARFSSLFVGAVAGLALGVIGSLITLAQAQTWFPTVDGTPLPGVTELTYFLIVVIAMFLRGGSLPQRGVIVEPRLPQAPAARRTLVPTAGFVAVVAVLLVILPFDVRQATITSLIGMIVCLSLVVITGFVGQVSLAQVALAGASGFVVSKLSLHVGIGFPFAPALGALVAMLLGTLVASSALRVRGVNLAIVTLAGAVAIEAFGFANSTWGAGGGGSQVGTPTLGGVDLGPGGSFFLGDDTLPSPLFGMVCLVVAAATGLLVAQTRRTLLGQRMLAVRSNERAAASVGIGVRNVKLAAFALSSGIAGVAGSLYAYSFGSVTAGRFGVMTALAFVAFAYMGGITTVSGAAVGGLLVSGGLVITLVQNLTGLPTAWELLFGGVALILTVTTSPAGIVGTRLPGSKARKQPGDEVVATHERTHAP
ncbi:ABC transporter permease [Streptomyces sp. NPDC002454]